MHKVSLPVTPLMNRKRPHLSLYQGCQTSNPYVRQKGQSGNRHFGKDTVEETTRHPRHRAISGEECGTSQDVLHHKREILVLGEEEEDNVERSIELDSS